MLFYKLISLFLLSFTLQAKMIDTDEVTVITADRIYSTEERSTNDIKVYSQKEISQTLSQDLPELLNHESDLSLTSSGPSGANTSLFLRGTDSSQTLVVVDGIIMNDPSNPNRQFDIGRMSLNNIEKIEILKGSQGLAYGSNAIGGVIVISTKKARENQLKGEGYFDFGTYKTINAGTNVQNKWDKLGLSFGVDTLKTEGFSAANVKVNPGADKDGERRSTFSFGSSYDFTKQLKLNVHVRYVRDEADLDKGGGINQDDPNDYIHNEELYSNIVLIKDWDSGNAETQFSYQLAKHFRTLYILPDSAHPESSLSNSNGVLNQFSLNHTYYPTEHLTQNINIDWQKESDQTNKTNTNVSAFLYHQWEQESYLMNFGIRVDYNQAFKTHNSFKLAFGKTIFDGLLKASYSTGFRAPSLNQLYDPIYGNKNLTPETSQSYELSFDKKFTNKFKKSSTLFFTKIDNRLSYDPITYINLNSGKARIIGFEDNTTYNWNTSIAQSLSFTLLRTKDLNLNQKLIRRPDFTLKNSLETSLNDQHIFGCDLQFVSSRLDIDSNSKSQKDSSYFLINLNYKLIINAQSDFYFKFKNILNKDYEEVFGYGTAGRTMAVGTHFIF